MLSSYSTFIRTLSSYSTTYYQKVTGSIPVMDSESFSE